MKYIRNYKSFIKESKKQIEKNGMLVEKQMLEEFSSDFWSLCMRSSIFTNEEKSYIQDRLSERSVSLVSEEWDWLDKAVDWAKDKGEKMLNFVSDKIKALKESLKGFVSSMVAFAKQILMSWLNSALHQAAKLKAKISGNAKIKKQIHEIDPVESKNEIEDFKKTMQFWSPGKSAAEAKPNAAVAAAQIEAKLKSAEAEAMSSTEKNLAEAQEEAANESISSIIYSTNEDVLKSFYDLSLIKEADVAEAEGEKKSTGQKCVDWLLSFLGQSNLDPDASTGKKLFWWGKLFLKVLSVCFSPILKLVETLVKSGANLGLKIVSMMTGALGGPGAFEFAILGGLCGGIVGIVYDGLMIGGVHSAGADTMAIVKKWLSHAVNEALDLFPSYKTLKFILACFCGAMTLWHVMEELAHLGILPDAIAKFFGGHGHEGHGEEHGKEHGEAKPAEPGKPEATGTEKTATAATTAAPGKPATTPAPAE